MWKKLFAAAASLGLTAAAATAQQPGGAASPFLPPDPVSPPPGLPADELNPAPPRPKSRPPAPNALEVEGFRGGVFVPDPEPIPGLIGAVPAGGQGQPGRPADPSPPAVGGVFDPAFVPIFEDFARGPARAPNPGPARVWVWGSGEILLGTGTGTRVPSLITTGPAAAGLFNAGALGQPGTVVLFGGRRMLDDWRAGVRAELGVWFGRDHLWGASARFYSLFSTSEQFEGVSDGANVINLPQAIPVGGVRTQFPAYAAFPGVTIGSAFATAQTQFAGGDLNLRRVLHSDPRLRIEAFGGYRQLHLGDELGDSFRVQSAVIPFPTAPILIGDDSIRTRNNFYGAQLGGLGSVVSGRWSFQGTMATALGVTASDFDFSRTRLATVGAVPPVVLEQVTDGGRVNYLGVVSEGGVRVGFRLAAHAKVTCGYTALYWWNVRRASEQFDLSATPSTRTTYYLAHMFSAGLDVRF